MADATVEIVENTVGLTEEMIEAGCEAIANGFPDSHCYAADRVTAARVYEAMERVRRSSSDTPLRSLDAASILLGRDCSQQLR